MEPGEFIWRDGERIGWDQATTRVLTHALHYGFAVFGGIRSYEQADGAVVEGRGENLSGNLVEAATGVRVVLLVAAASVRPLVQQGNRFNL